MALALPETNVFLEPLNIIWNKIVEISPGLLWALVIILVGYLVSALLGWITKKILYRINLDKSLRRLDLHDSMGDVSISKLAGLILKWYIFVLFLNEAIIFIDLGVVSTFLGKVVSWLPELILSIAIIIGGLILIDFIIHRLLELKNRYIRAIANILKGILIIIVMFTAIEHLGIKTQLAQQIFLMILGAVLVTFSLAFGIGLGLSLKDEMRPVIKRYTKRFK